MSAVEQISHLPDQLPWLMTVLDLVGVFFFATSGALLASRKGFDLVGSMFLSLLAGLGGGVTRDVLLDRGIPASLENPIYLAPPLLVSLLVYFNVIHPNRLNLTITIFDAGGLALFTVTGTMVAMEAGAHPVSCVLIGMLSAIGGGLLRDIVANDVPTIFDPRGIYALPSLLGAIVVVLIHPTGWMNVVTGTLVAALVFTVRMLGYHYQWRVPGADISMDQDSLDRLRAAAQRAVEARRPRRPRFLRSRGASPRSTPSRAPASSGPTTPPPPSDLGALVPEQPMDGFEVQHYNPETEAVTVRDTASGQVAHLDPATGILDVIDPRTGWTMSYDDEERRES